MDQTSKLVEVLWGILPALLGVLVALPAAFIASKKRLDKRLDAISGGLVTSLEDLVAAATAEKRRRLETDIAVYGKEELWAEVRKSGFRAARIADDKPGAVAVVDPEQHPDVHLLREPFVLIYTPGTYTGKLPPGAAINYANSEVTLHARLAELLAYREARS